MHRIVLAIALLAVLAGCGAGTDPLGTGGAAVVEVVQDVEYYHACGNEVLELPDGRRFFPLLDQDGVDEDAYAGGSAAGPQGLVLAAGLVLAVVEPGPGDDVGTLTVYEDGMASFVSDSGIEAWLDDEEREYDWEC